MAGAHVITARQAAILRALSSEPINIQSIGERCGIESPLINARACAGEPRERGLRFSLRRFKRSCLRLLPAILRLERRGLLTVTRRNEPIHWRVSETVRGRATLALHEGRDVEDNSKLLGLLPRDPLMIGEPGEFVYIVDRVDDVVPTMREDVEPWTDTREWYRIHWWIGYYWQRERAGELRGEREQYHDCGGGDHLGLPLRNLGGFGSVVYAAERVFRNTGKRRVAIYRCLPSASVPSLDLEYVGRACD